MNPHPDSAKLWKKLRVPDCTQCPLHTEAQSVCLLGDGPVPCDIMAIGEAPGFREDSVKIPFSGRSGIFFRKQLKEVGIDPRQIFITNVAACRPPQNRTPRSSEAKTCSSLYLVPQIEMVKPKAILLLGKTAIHFVTQFDENRKKRRPSVTAVEGTTLYYKGIPCLASRHPAAVIRAEDDESYPYHVQAFVENLIYFKRLLNPVKDNFKVRTDLDIKPFLESEKPIYVDLETTSLNPFLPESKIHCIGIGQDPEDITSVVWTEGVKRKIKRLLEAIPIMAHRATFEGTWLRQHVGVTPRIYYDTKLGAFVRDENVPSGLKPRAIMDLKVEPWDNPGVDRENPDIPRLLRYNGRDVKHGIRLFNEVDIPYLKKHPRVARLLKYILLPAEEVFTEVICNGFHIDENQAKEKLAQCISKKAKLNKELNKYAGRAVKPGSNKDMPWLFYDKLGLKCPVRTEKGKDSTAEASLIRLKGQHPAVQILTDWREQDKYRGTYLEPWLKKGPILHARYDFTGTDTGRLSSSMVSTFRGQKKLGAVLHQCPRNKFIRNLITPRYSGWVILAADLSQAELRFVAHESRDETMCDIFSHDPHTPEGDIHLATVMDILRVAQDKIDEETRKKGKAVNFGFVYGMFAKKFQIYALEKFDVKFTGKESEEYREGYFNKYARLRGWHDRVEGFVRSNGWIESVFGRIRHLPKVLYDSPYDEWIVRENVRYAINSPIQSAASDLDLYIAALILSYSLDWDFKADRERVLMIGAAHDSLLFEVERSYAKTLKKGILWTVANLPVKKHFGFQFRVPMFMDINIYEDCWKGKEIEV